MKKTQEQTKVLNPEIRAHEALAKLLAGNKRYSDDKTISPNRTAQHRMNTLDSQTPFAVIVSCADSRVPPEVVFDTGINDLFVTRVAGNSLTDHITASVEYAVKYLDVPLVMVLGHEDCGMFKTALENNGKDMPAHMNILLDAIRPAIERAKNQSGDIMENSIKANVQIEVEKLRNSQPMLSNYIKENRLKIVGGYYNLKSGVVDIITPFE